MRVSAKKDAAPKDAMKEARTVLARAVVQPRMKAIAELSKAAEAAADPNQIRQIARDRADQLAERATRRGQELLEAARREAQRLREEAASQRRELLARAESDVHDRRVANPADVHGQSTSLLVFLRISAN